MKYFSVDNLGKPVNKTWKAVSKWLCRTLPIYITIIAAIPNEYLSMEIKIWINVVLSLIVASISGLSELTTNENNTP